MSTHQSFTLSVPVDTTDHIAGQPHSPITLVEYGDFECPNCKQAAPVVKLILERFPGKVQFVFRHFPIEGAHPHALMAAEAAEAAGAQGRFWEMHDALFENQAHLKLQHLRSYAERLQLHMTRFNAEMDDHIYTQRVREHQQSANDSGVRGTPTFFVNGKIHDVSFGIHTLMDTVEKMLHV